MAQISQAQLIKTSSQEGCILHVYDDGFGNATIGYGTCYYPNGIKVQFGDSDITQEQALNYLENECNHIADQITELVTQIINQNQLDALIDFCYNEGIEHFKTSTLLQVINNNPEDFGTIHTQFLRWDYVDHEINQDLLNRREQEYQTYIA